jgi:hypothetical protein
MSEPAMAAPGAPLEPVLELGDIQGASVPGFLKPHQALIGISCDDSPENATAFRRFIRNMSSQVATGAETLKDRREHRKLKLAGRADEK